MKKKKVLVIMWRITIAGLLLIFIIMIFGIIFYIGALAGGLLG